ncbi:MAG: hypothetical protein GY948_17995 [Alphaproteobacteria bacterium]|nr:hypothetical protein [Alphaproteobacteria bacterium]
MTGPATALKRWFRQQRDAAYLTNMSALAWADVGASKGDLLQIAKGPTCVGERMQAMAAAYGLEPADLAGERWRQLDMARACSNCSESRQCKRWLKGPDLDLAQAGFCPNKSHFSELSGKDQDALEAEDKSASQAKDERLHYL